MHSVYIVSILLSCVILKTEAAINVCIPIAENVNNEQQSLDEVLSDLKAEIGRKISKNNDPIQLGRVVLDVTHEAIRLNGTLDNATLYNLFDYKMCLFDIDLAAGKFDVFNLTFNYLTVVGDYDLTGNIGELFDIFGKDGFWVKMSNFSIAMSFNMLLNKTDICFPINIDINLIQMQNDFNNFMNDPELDDLLNKAISTLFPDIIDILWAEANGEIVESFNNAIIDILQHQNVPSILNKILTNSKSKLPLLPFCFTGADVINKH